MIATTVTSWSNKLLFSMSYKIYVFVELILEHLHCLLTDVLSQPNFPPGNVDRPAGASP